MPVEISIIKQSASSNYIIKAINRINTASQKAASGFEELAVGADELSSQAEVLHNIDKKYKTDDNQYSNE